MTLRYTLLAEGSTDEVLLPVLDWTIRQHTSRVFRGEFAYRRGQGLTQKILDAAILRQAVGKPNSRIPQIPAVMRRITMQFTHDFSPLLVLRSFVRLQEDVKRILEIQGWDTDDL
jgi:hypothetical protein